MDQGNPRGLAVSRDPSKIAWIIVERALGGQAWKQPLFSKPA